ncbi:MAG TPA: hypothetical protein VFB38_23970 [Chthonomonadaceae bacterium]|nr:hypothetical protein [Chthonomonadaceae bacterium]
MRIRLYLCALIGLCASLLAFPALAQGRQHRPTVGHEVRAAGHNVRASLKRTGHRVRARLKHHRHHRRHHHRRHHR